MTKKITLLCAAGMSTSLLVNKMKEAATKYFDEEKNLRVFRATYIQ